AVADRIGGHRPDLTRGDHQRDEVAAPAFPAPILVVADGLLEERVVIVENLGAQLRVLAFLFRLAGGHGSSKLGLGDGSYHAPGTNYVGAAAWSRREVRAPVRAIDSGRRRAAGGGRGAPARARRRRPSNRRRARVAGRRLRGAAQD